MLVNKFLDKNLWEFQLVNEMQKCTYLTYSLIRALREKLDNSSLHMIDRYRSTLWHNSIRFYSGLFSFKKKNLQNSPTTSGLMTSF